MPLEITDILAALIPGFGQGYLKERVEGPERRRKQKIEDENRQLGRMTTGAELRSKAKSPEELDSLAALLEKLGVPNQGSALPGRERERFLSTPAPRVGFAGGSPSEADLPDLLAGRTGATSPYKGSTTVPGMPQDPMARMLMEQRQVAVAEQQRKAGLESRRAATGESTAATAAGGLQRQKDWDTWLKEKGYPYKPVGGGGFGIGSQSNEERGLAQLLLQLGLGEQAGAALEPTVRRVRKRGAPIEGGPETRTKAGAVTVERRGQERDARLQRLQASLTGPERARVDKLKQQISISAQGRKGKLAPAVAQREGYQREIDRILDTAEQRGGGAQPGVHQTIQGIRDSVAEDMESGVFNPQEMQAVAKKYGITFSAEQLANPQAVIDRLDALLMGLSEGP